MLDLKTRLDDIRSAGLHRAFRSFGSAQGPRVQLESREVVNLCSNNYLGLAGSAELREAVADACAQWGVGSGGSRLIGGTTEVHTALESAIARFKGKEAAVTFNCGYVANVTTLQSLATKGTVVYSDALNHASIIDGCRLSGADVRVYAHGDAGELEEMVEKGGPGLIVTDGVFSMTGDVADLGALDRIARAADCTLYVDDAHGTGVLGGTGRGTAEVWGVEPDVNMGTLSKAVGAQGGFVAGSAELAEYLTNTARGLIYSTAYPASMAAAALKGLELCQGPKRRAKLFENVRRLKEGLAEQGFEQDVSGVQTPIIPVVLGDNSKVVKVSRMMLQRGVFCHPIRYPTVPEDQAMLRLTVMATHTAEDLDAGLKALKDSLKDVIS